MRIQVASDLHLDFLEGRFARARLIAPASGANLPVLGCDIHNGVMGIQALAD